jgi:hypothetical protein
MHSLSASPAPYEPHALQAVVEPARLPRRMWLITLIADGDPGWRDLRVGWSTGRFRVDRHVVATYLGVAVLLALLGCLVRCRDPGEPWPPRLARHGGLGRRPDPR